MSSVGRQILGTPASSYLNLSSKFSRSFNSRLPSIISSSIFDRRTPQLFRLSLQIPTSISSEDASNAVARAVKRPSASFTVAMKSDHILSQTPFSLGFSPASGAPEPLRPEPSALNSRPILSSNRLRTQRSTRVASRRISSLSKRPDTSSSSLRYNSSSCL